MGPPSQVESHPEGERLGTPSSSFSETPIAVVFKLFILLPLKCSDVFQLPSF